MNQFIHASDAALTDIQNRAAWTCIRFRGQEMPPGSEPRHADIGFEINPHTGAAKLLVQNGLRYRGDHSEVAEWLEAGEKEFRNFDDLKAWMRQSLKGAFAEDSSQQSATQTAGAECSESITDLPALRSRVRARRPAAHAALDGKELFDRIVRRVRGQDHAIRSLATVVARHSARRHPKRPAVLFAVGPSGVGKTQSAETLAEVLAEISPDGEGYRFLRLDMTEYQESHRVSQLLGAPQGYVGHEEGSELLDALEENPKTIVLFDEIEKAHPAILRVLMNGMDAGRLSRPARNSSSGHRVDCREAIFIFTSNLDAQAILDELERRNGFGERAVEDEICRRRLHGAGIAPEIVGRIGRFLVYRYLDEEVRAEILALSIAEVASEYGISVQFVEPDAVLALLAETPQRSFGARPDQYLIDEMLGESFARSAAEGLDTTWKVTGHPFRCVPFSKDDRKSSAIAPHNSLSEST